jgi:hypothetical protein
VDFRRKQKNEIEREREREKEEEKEELKKRRLTNRQTTQSNLECVCMSVSRHHQWPRIERDRKVSERGKEEARAKVKVK